MFATDCECERAREREREERDIVRERKIKRERKVNTADSTHVVTIASEGELRIHRCV